MSTETHYPPDVGEPDDRVDIGLDDVDLDDDQDDDDDTTEPERAGSVQPRPSAEDGQDSTTTGQAGQTDKKKDDTGKTKPEDRMVPVGPAVATAGAGGLAAAGIIVQAASAAGPAGAAIAGGVVLATAAGVAVARGRRKGRRNGGGRNRGRGGFGGRPHGGRTNGGGTGSGLPGFGGGRSGGRSGGTGSGLPGFGGGRGRGGSTGGARSGGFGGGSTGGTGTGGGRGRGSGGTGAGGGGRKTGGTGGTGRRSGGGSGGSWFGGRGRGSGRGSGGGSGSWFGGSGRGRGSGGGWSGGRGRGHGGGSGSGNHRNGGNGRGRGGSHRRPGWGGRAANAFSRGVQSPFKAFGNGMRGARKGQSPFAAAQAARKRALKAHRAGRGLNGTQHPFRGWGAAGAGMTIYGIRRLWAAFMRMWRWNPARDAALDAEAQQTNAQAQANGGRPNVGNQVDDPNTNPTPQNTTQTVNTPTPAQPEPIRPPNPDPSNGGDMAQNGVPTINQLIRLSEELLRATKHRAAPGARPGMLEVVEDSKGWAIILDNVRQAAAAECAAWHRFPVHPSIPAMYDAVDQTMRNGTAAMVAIPGVIERVERENLEKLRNPHPSGNQQMYDVTANGHRGGGA